METLKLDAPYYTEEELDALYEINPREAMRISREQMRLKRELESTRIADTGVGMPGEEQLRPVIEQARQILRRDGGDVELVEVSGDTVRVRMRGACAGCPRAALDVRSIVERLIRQHYPQVRAVRNTL